MRPASPLRRPAKLLAVLLGALLLALAIIALAGITIDAGRWREPIARSLAEAIGRDVTLDGPAELVVSLWPQFRVGGIHIANPPGFASPEFARVGELRLAADLLPLLAGEVRVRELEGRDVDVRLARGADGQGNWTFAPPTKGERKTERAQAPFTLPKLDVHRIALERVTLEFEGAEGARRFEVAALAGEAKRGQPTRLEVSGAIERQFPYKLALVGAPLTGLGEAAPWRFDASLAFLATTVTGSGTVTGPFEQPAVELAFAAGTENFREIGRLLQMTPPPLGASSFAGTLAWTPGRLALREFRGAAGETALAGELLLETDGERPKLTGALTAPAFDVLPFYADNREAPQTLAETLRELARKDLDLRGLAAIDADVTLVVDQWLNVPGDLRDSTLRLRIDAGRLTVPLKVMIAGARFEGEAAADGTATPGRIRLALAARDSPLGGIAEVLFGAPEIDGRFRHFDLSVEAEGEKIGALLRSLDIRAALDGAVLTYGNFEGGVPVKMRLDALRITHPRGRPLEATMRGALLDKPFSGTFRADAVSRLLADGRTSFTFDAQATGVRVRLAGELAQRLEASGPEVTFALDAPHARDVAVWLGISNRSDARVAIKGRALGRRDVDALSITSLELGRTSGTADLQARREQGGRLLRATVALERIDAPEMQALAPAREKGTRAAIDVPILPARMNLAESDLELRVKRIDGLPLSISDLAFEGRVRSGAMEAAPFSLRVEETPLTGAVAFDLHSKTPTSSLWLSGDNVDVGALLRRLGVAQHIEAQAGHLSLHAQIQESRLGPALERSSVVANIDSGRLVLRDENTKGTLWIQIESGELRADPGEPLRLTLAGRVNRTPVSLRITTGRLRQFLENDKHMPFALEADGADARLVIAGEVAPAAGTPDVDLTVAFTGSSLDKLGPFLRTSLPPWGPYAAAGRVRISKRGYEVEDLRLSVGESVLDGRGALDTTRERPQLQATFSAEHIQLDDFRLDEWSPFDSRAAATGKSLAAGLRDAATGASAEVQALLSPAVLNSHDGTLAVEVKQVLSGKDVLGNGKLAARVAHGRAEIGPVEVNMPGGSATASLAYEPGEAEVATETRIRVDRFDYGVLARRIQPDTDVAGTFSLDLDLRARTPRLSAALEQGDGHIDFAVWPHRMFAGVFDRLGTNLLLAMVAAVNPDASRVNCAVGQFDLKGGQLESAHLVIDTTHTRAMGSGRIDFPQERVEFRLAPRPKVPQFFTLATPVEVSGTFQDFHANVRAASVLGAVAQWVTSLVVVPIQKLFMGRPPADGQDVCTNPMRDAALK